MEQRTEGLNEALADASAVSAVTARSSGTEDTGAPHLSRSSNWSEIEVDLLDDRRVCVPTADQGGHRNPARPTDLSVATVAARQRINARQIQRLFESEGTTFTEYVVAQRLARAHRVLTNPLHASQKISTIALDVGFGDLSHFNRAFRRRFGMAPSDLRAGGRLAD